MTKPVNFYAQYGADVHSQNGEDGLLGEIFRRLKIDKGTFCEFGAADGKYCSNSYYLLEQGWTGKFIEANPAHAKALIDNTMGKPAELHFGPVTAANINALVPQKLNLLSIDVDNDDFHLWNAYAGIADVVVIEVNSGIAPPEVVVPGSRGSSFSAMVMLGICKGYFLLAHKGNCVFLLNKYRLLFPEVVGDGFSNPDDFFDRSWL
jgi:hypothetical protein